QGVIGTTGAWEITVEPLIDGTYAITAEAEDLAGNISVLSNPLTITIDTTPPNTPYLALTTASDAGRNNQDRITRTNTPTSTITATDTPGGGPNASPHDIRYRIYDRPGTGPEVLLVDSFVNLAALSAGNFFMNPLPVLADGVHNLKAIVEDRAGNLSDPFFLQVVIDTMPPPAPAIGLQPPRDSGVVSNPATFTDR